MSTIDIKNYYSEFVASLEDERIAETKLQAAKDFAGTGILSGVLKRVSNIGTIEKELRQTQRDSVRIFANVQREIARTPGSYPLARISGSIDARGDILFDYDANIKMEEEGYSFPVSFTSNYLNVVIREGLSWPQLVVLEYDALPTIQLTRDYRILLETKPVWRDRLWGEVSELYAYWQPTEDTDLLLPPSFKDIPWVASKERAAGISDKGRTQDLPSDKRFIRQNTEDQNVIYFDWDYPNFLSRLEAYRAIQPQHFLRLP